MSAGISPELSPEASSEISLVRPGGPADIAAVVRLEQECLGGDAWSEGLIRDGIERGLPTIEYLVAEVDDEVVGHAVTSNAGDIAELQRIAVTEAHRRQGVGARLLAGVVDSARGTLAERLLLEVREDNRGALSFYASQGFVEIDRRPRYYADGATAIVMRRPLIQGCGGSELLAVH